jgi:hypothetical protein
MIPVRARIGATEWQTSLFPKDGLYVVPLKDAVRRAEGLDEGDTVTVRLTVAGPQVTDAREGTGSIHRLACGGDDKDAHGRGCRPAPRAKDLLATDTKKATVNAALAEVVALHARRALLADAADGAFASP